MSLRVTVRDRGALYEVRGPRDLGDVGEGATVYVGGTAEPERGHARWSGAIGSAVLRGASVVRR
jgi:hypothetical protein